MIIPLRGNDSRSDETYCNPVFAESFPDPFVLKFRGEYFAYCTGTWKDGRAFGILRSQNLFEWEEIGGAMDIDPNGPPLFWAPEVTYSEGKFYLYYSAGNETLMEIRVAVSERPDGGFEDRGIRLTYEEFAIDPHVLTDADGDRYMFYATDFLDHSHIGTGTVVDRMTDWFTLAGEPRAVTRPKFDWQVYDPARKEKGGVRWHTVEGPFVLERKGEYFQMFSGGNWQNLSYGVSFATSNEVVSKEEWVQFSDGETVLPILRTVPEEVSGPGHNSVIAGPNNRELFCVYHKWRGGERVPAIDRLDFAGGRIFVIGPTNTPQLAPFSPSTSVRNRFLKGSNGVDVSRGTANNTSFENSGLNVPTGKHGFLTVFTARFLHLTDRAARFRIALNAGAASRFSCEFYFDKNILTTSYSGGEDPEQKQGVSSRIDAAVFHEFRVEMSGRCVRVAVDETEIIAGVIDDEGVSRFRFEVEDGEAEIADLSLTQGFEDLFDRTNERAAELGWQVIGSGEARIIEKELVIIPEAGEGSVAVKGISANSYEFAANIRLAEVFETGHRFGFCIFDGSGLAHRFAILPVPEGYMLTGGADGSSIRLPDFYRPEDIRQFRFLKTDGLLRLEMETETLAEISLNSVGELSRIGIFCENCIVAVDMVRVTIL